MGGHSPEGLPPESIALNASNDQVTLKRVFKPFPTDTIELPGPRNPNWLGLFAIGGYAF